MSDKEKILGMIQELNDISVKYLSNVNLYMKISTAEKLLGDIRGTIEFIEENKNNDKC